MTEREHLENGDAEEETMASAPPAQAGGARDGRFVISRIDLDLPDLGKMQLRRLSYSGAVEALVGQELPARELAARLVHDHLVEPQLPVEQVIDWPDHTLTAVLATWVREDGQLRSPLDAAAPFESFRDAVLAYVQAERERLASIIRPLLIELQRQGAIYRQFLVSAALPAIQLPRIEPPTFWTAPAVDALHSHVAEVSAALRQAVLGVGEQLSAVSQILAHAFEPGRFITQLPDLSGLVRQFEELARRQAQGEAVLAETGYGFATSLFASYLLADVATIAPTVRGAAVTNSLLAHTRDPQFEQDLRGQFEASSVLRRRWPVVERALAVHRDRDYLLSIPPLLAQIDGIMADALILKNLVRPVGRKLYAKDADGHLKLNKKRKPIELRGLGQLVQHHDFQDHEVLRSVVELLTDRLIQDRNGVLHGRRTAYGKAKLSVTAVLVLAVLAAEVAAFETGEASDVSS